MREPEPKYGENKFLYATGEVGFMTASLQNLTGRQLTIPATQAAGVVLGADLGLRLGPFTLGPHFRYAPMDNFDYLTFGGDLGFRFAIARVDLSLRVLAGYVETRGVTIAQVDTTAVANAQTPQEQAAALQNAVTIAVVNGEGAKVGGNVGLDFFIFQNLSIGARVAGEVLFVNLPIEGLLADSSSLATQEALANSLVGGNFSVVGVIGGHL